MINRMLLGDLDTLQRYAYKSIDSDSERAKETSNKIVEHLKWLIADAEAGKVLFSGFNACGEIEEVEPVDNFRRQKLTGRRNMLLFYELAKEE